MGERSLEQRLVAAEKTIAALLRRVEEKVASGESAFAVLEQNIALERVVAEKTRQLAVKQAELEESLKESREARLALSLAQEIALTGNWVWDLVSGQVSWSTGHYRILGLAPNAVTPSQELLIRHVHPDDRAAVQGALSRALEQHGSFELEYRIIRADGRERFVYGRGQVLVDDRGRSLKVIETRQDITERKEMQARLVRSERMASLGTLAGGVAHEINNPLSYVTSNVRFIGDELAALARRLPETRATEISSVLAETLQGLDRIRRIVGDLRAFSRVDPQLGPVDLHRVLDLAVSMASSQIRFRARLVKDYAQVPPVEGNESRLGQVFLNLLINAAEAIPDGHPEENEIRVVTRAVGSSCVAVEIQDTGCGIPLDIRDRIFEPFFTTKPVGTGLGLSICHGIITSFGGEISVESEVGRGSTFRVVLAVTDQTTAPLDSPTPPR
jgi:PAS domain S-box-containing protein